MSPPTSTTRMPSFVEHLKPGGTLAENAGATAAPSGRCIVGQGGAQTSTGDADLACLRPDSEKDNSSLLVVCNGGHQGLSTVVCFTTHCLSYSCEVGATVPLVGGD